MGWTNKPFHETAPADRKILLVDAHHMPSGPRKASSIDGALTFLSSYVVIPATGKWKKSANIETALYRTANKGYDYVHNLKTPKCNKRTHKLPDWAVHLPAVILFRNRFLHLSFSSEENVDIQKMIECEPLTTFNKPDDKITALVGYVRQLPCGRTVTRGLFRPNMDLVKKYGFADKVIKEEWEVTRIPDSLLLELCF